MVIRRVPHHHRLKLHVKGLSSEEKKTVRHIHVDNLGPGSVEDLTKLPHLVLVTYEPDIEPDPDVVADLRRRGISVVPIATPKKEKKASGALPEWYEELIE